jgi:sugar phosphate isomerase/epimerase
MAMRCGFHLSGLPHHDLATIARPLLEMGYHQVAVRVPSFLMAADDETVRHWMRRLDCFRAIGMNIVLDADGLFMTDPWEANAPRLARESESSVRETVLLRCIELTKQIDCGLLTFSVGSGDPGEDAESILRRVAASVTRLIHQATGCHVALAIKPMLGSAIETASQFRRLLQWLPESVASDPLLGWAADVSVMARRGEMPIGDRLERDSDRLLCIYLSDVAQGAMGDRRFGEGDLAMDRIIDAIRELPFDGPVIVRVDGYGEIGMLVAKEAAEVLYHGHPKNA